MEAVINGVMHFLYVVAILFTVFPIALFVNVIGYHIIKLFKKNIRLSSLGVWPITIILFSGTYIFIEKYGDTYQLWSAGTGYLIEMCCAPLISLVTLIVMSFVGDYYADRHDFKDSIENNLWAASLSAPICYVVAFVILSII